MEQSSRGKKHETQKQSIGITLRLTQLDLNVGRSIHQSLLYARQAILLPAILSFTSHARTAWKLVALPRPCVLTKIKNTFTVLVPKTSHARIDHAGPHSPDRVIML